jgi:hypothetical protein
MSGAFFQVSGIVSNEDARTVFVWCRDKISNDAVLLGTGHVAGAGGCFIPPGVPIGQFRVTFLLPSRNSAADLIVTADRDGKELLPDVTVTPCRVSAGSWSGLTIPLGGPSAPADTTNASPQPRHM